MIDDGWFKGRKNDRAGLGDWSVDTNKFPNGLSPMIGRINETGLDFGIWVEPEMINENSDLYRTHPDWILEFPNRTKDTWRHQRTLNFAREDVYQYIYKSMRELLANNNIKFIKWTATAACPSRDGAVRRPKSSGRSASGMSRICIG